jgi:hypothetical protein
VRAVADELAQADGAVPFGDALQELVELASAGHLLVAVDGDALVVTTERGRFRLVVEQ